MSTTTLVDKKWKTFTFIATGLFVVALVFAIVFGVNALKNKKRNVESQTQIETLQKENNSLVSQVTTLTSNRSELQQSLSQADESLKTKEVVISRLNDENRTLNTIKTQITQMESATTEINASNAKLQKIQKDMKATIDQRQRVNASFQASHK
jgi:uncharacterized protein YlxW (UPF0749 family)